MKGPHPERRLLQAPGSPEVPGENEHRREKSVQRAELGGRALPRRHVHLAVPQTVPGVVGEPVQGAQALARHPSAVRVAEELRALDEILVVRVDPAAHVARAARPLPRLDVDLLADEAELRAPLEEGDERFLRLLEVDRLARVTRERAELEHEGPDLRRIRSGAARPARLQVHEHVRHSGRRLECREEPGSEVVGEPQEPRVAGHLVTGQEAAQQADRDLEVLDRDVPVEGEPVDDQRPGLVGVLGQTHQEQRVERIHGGHEKRLAPVPVAGRPGERLQLVVPPRGPLICPPAEDELFADAGRERSAISIGQPTGSLRSGAGESERGPDQDGGGEREAFPARRHASAVASVPRYAVSAQTIRIAAPIAR